MMVMVIMPGAGVREQVGDMCYEERPGEAAEGLVASDAVTALNFFF